MIICLHLQIVGSKRVKGRTKSPYVFTRARVPADVSMSHKLKNEPVCAPRSGSQKHLRPSFSPKLAISIPNSKVQSPKSKVAGNPQNGPNPPNSPEAEIRHRKCVMTNYPKCIRPLDLDTLVCRSRPGQIMKPGQVMTYMSSGVKEVNVEWGHRSRGSRSPETEVLKGQVHRCILGKGGIAAPSGVDKLFPECICALDL